MHPIVSRKGRLAAYLGAWVPLGAVLLVVLVRTGGLRWGEAAAVAGPLTLVYAFGALGAWYVCRSFPVESTRPAKLAAVNLAAAVVDGLLWMLLANGLAAGYTASGLFPDLERRFEQKLPLVFGIGVLLWLLSAAGHYLILAVEGFQQARGREAEARLLARDAELRALRAQVNPHFLFNSLHSISALTASDPARARRMCIELSEFLRNTIGLGGRPSIPLAEELALARSYLAVEGVRFGARLSVAEEVESGCARCLIPPLLLQPLVENAVRHGVATLLEGGRIRLVARRSSRALRIVIENDFDPEAPPRRAGGVGLGNVRARLEALYGAAARLEAGARDRLFRAEILLPAEEEQPATPEPRP